MTLPFALAMFKVFYQVLSLLMGSLQVRDTGQFPKTIVQKGKAKTTFPALLSGHLACGLTLLARVASPTSS